MNGVNNYCIFFQSNKEQYLQLVTQWRMTRGIEEQTNAFLDGFNEVVISFLLPFFLLS